MRSFALVFALALIGCAQTVDETGAASNDISEAPAPTSVEGALAPIVAKGEMTDADFAGLKPMLDALPGRATPESRAVVTAYFKIKIADAARASLDLLVAHWGYRLEGASDAAAAIASNVTEEDTDFTALCSAVKGCSEPYLLGMIDGGFIIDHPALDGRFWTNLGEIPGNNVDDDGDGYVDDIHGFNITVGSGDLGKEPFMMGGSAAHGTNTAAIALRGTKKIALIGTTAGNGRSMAEAIHYLAAHGAKVVSFSLSTWGEWVADVVAAMDAHPDVLFLESAGNNGEELKTTPTITATTDLQSIVRPNFVKVAAAEVDLTRQKTSNYSATLVDLSAVGPQFSAVPPEYAPSGYVFEGQTSESTPYAANAAVRVRMLAPKLSATQVKALLVASSDERPEWKGVVVANGLVNVLRATQTAAFYTLTSDGMSAAEASAKLAIPASEQAKVAALAASLH